MRVLPFCYCRKSPASATTVLQPRSPSPFPPSRQYKKGRTTLSDYSLSPLLPWIVCGLEDRITLQECPLVFQSLHHLHLSTLQPFSLPAKIVCLENVPAMMHPEMSANKGFSSRLWAHRRSLPCLVFSSSS